MAELMMRRGDIVGRGAANSGLIWGSAINQLGNIASGAIQQHGEREQAEAMRAEEEQTRSGLAELAQSDIWKTDPGAGLARATELLGEDGITWAKGYLGLADTARDPKTAAQNLPQIAAAWKVMAPEDRQEFWPTVRGVLGSAMPEWELPEVWSEEMMPLVDKVLEQYAPKAEAEWGFVPGDPTQEINKITREVRPTGVEVPPEETDAERLARLEAESAARARGTASVKGAGAGGDYTKTGEEFLATIPIEQQATVKQLGEYRRRPSATLYRSESGKALLRMVSQYNPEYDEKLYGEAQKAIGEYTSGATHRNIIAINTLSHHLVPFAEAAAALETGNVQELNKLRNYFLEQFGQEAPTNFSALKHLVSDEIANTFKTTGATDSTIKNAAETLGRQQSPAQLLGALRRLARLSEGRIRAIGNKYDVTFGEGAFDKKGYISDEARHAYEMIGSAEDLGQISEGGGTVGLEEVADALAALNLSPEELAVVTE